MSLEIIKVDDITGFKSELNITAIEKKNELIELASKIENVNNVSSQENAVEILNKIKAFSKQIEESRVTAKAPFLSISKQIDTVTKEFSKPLGESQNKITKLLSDYVNEQRRIQLEEEKKKRIEEEKRLKEEEEKKKTETPEVSEKDKPKEIVIAPEKKIQTKIQGVKNYTVRKFEIENIEELRFVKTEFFELNESKLKEWIKGFKIEAEESYKIAGVKIWDELEIK